MPCTCREAFNDSWVAVNSISFACLHVRCTRRNQENHPHSRSFHPTALVGVDVQGMAAHGCEVLELQAAVEAHGTAADVGRIDGMHVRHAENLPRLELGKRLPEAQEVPHDNHVRVHHDQFVHGPQDTELVQDGLEHVPARARVTPRKGAFTARKILSWCRMVLSMTCQGHTTQGRSRLRPPRRPCSATSAG